MPKIRHARLSLSRTVALTVYAAGCLLLLRGPALANGDGPRDANTATVTSAMAGLRTFDQSGSLNELRSVIDTLIETANVTGLPHDELNSDRLVIAKAWVAVLKRIEASYGPAFDPYDGKNQPMSCVPPPIESDGTQLRGCVSPGDIKDEKARAEYLLALDRNKAKEQRMQRWIEVHELDDLAMTYFEVTLKLFRDVVGPDPRVSRIVQAGGLSPARTKTLEDWLSSPGP